MFDSLTEKENKALKAAACALYFDDSADFRSALWEVVNALTEDTAFYEEDIDEDEFIEKTARYFLDGSIV